MVARELLLRLNHQISSIVTSNIVLQPEETCIITSKKIRATFTHKLSWLQFLFVINLNSMPACLLYVHFDVCFGQCSLQYSHLFSKHLAVFEIHDMYMPKLLRMTFQNSAACCRSRWHLRNGLQIRYHTTTCQQRRYEYTAPFLWQNSF